MSSIAPPSVDSDHQPIRPRGEAEAEAEAKAGDFTSEEEDERDLDFGRPWPVAAGDPAGEDAVPEGWRAPAPPFVGLLARLTPVTPPLDNPPFFPSLPSPFAFPFPADPGDPTHNPGPLPLDFLAAGEDFLFPSACLRAFTFVGAPGVVTGSAAAVVVPGGTADWVTAEVLFLEAFEAPLIIALGPACLTLSSGVKNCGRSGGG